MNGGSSQGATALPLYTQQRPQAYLNIPQTIESKYGEEQALWSILLYYNSSRHRERPAGNVPELHQPLRHVHTVVKIPLPICYQFLYTVRDRYTRVLNCQAPLHALLPQLRVRTAHGTGFQASDASVSRASRPPATVLALPELPASTLQQSEL